MDLNPSIGFDDLSWDAVLRLLGAAVAGLIIGIDRETKGHGPGMRTHAILAFAAALVTVTAMALYYQLGGAEAQADPLRVIEGTAAMAGVIAGALIVFARGEARNLTTAAHLWLAGVIGIAFGAGLYPLGIIGTLVSVVLLTVFRGIERRAFDKEQGHGPE